LFGGGFVGGLGGVGEGLVVGGEWDVGGTFERSTLTDFATYAGFKGHTFVRRNRGTPIRRISRLHPCEKGKVFQKGKGCSKKKRSESDTGLNGTVEAKSALHPVFPLVNERRGKGKKAQTQRIW